MGLFSRKEAASTRRQVTRPRPSVSSEAQAAALRVRARRRLAGAVALVLAAVIVLPMLLDGESRPVPAGLEISIPSKESPMPAPPTPAVAAPLVAPAVNDPAPAAAAQAPLAEAAVAAIQPKPAAEKPKTPDARPEPTVAKPADPRARSDDGNRALALLEGRATATDSTAVPTGSSRFVVQLASYGAEGDANERRDKLRSQGITNAYVEPVTVSGKAMFRLRVGPFSSRDAAQAAQTRLRTLGYHNGFIASP